MTRRDPTNWMMSEAVEMLLRAEEMHRQFFRLTPGSQEPSWSPPVDVLETDREILVLVALPGVDPEEVEATIENGALVVAGRRTLPAELRNAVIHRLELPQGRFERRIALPPGRFLVSRSAANGCIVLNLRKV